MRKRALFMTVLLLGLVTACGGQPAAPTPSPSPVPATDTPPSAAATEAPAAAVTPSGPASCVEAALDFPPEPRIPDVTADDHVHGPEDAAITFIEYADFQ